MAIRSLYPQKKKTDRYNKDEKSRYEDSDEDEEDSDDEDSNDEYDEGDSDNEYSEEESANDEDNDDDEEDSDDEDTLDGEVLDDAVFCKAKPCKFNSSSLHAGIRIVNCKSGKRIELSKKILSALGNPDEVSFLYTNKFLFIATTDKAGFLLRGKRHNTIYSAALVAEITKRFSLDFNGCTCISCPDVKAIDDDDVNAVAIVMR